MKRIVLVVFILLAGFAGYIFSKKFFRQEVVVSAVFIDRAISSVRGTVEVNADFSTDIRTGEGGRILEVLIEAGQEVFEGDIVARIDTTDLEIALEDRNIELAAAKRKIEIGNSLRFKVELAEETMEEVNRQFERGQRSGKQVKAAERSLTQARETLALSELQAETAVKKLENGIKILNRRIDKMTIKSSISGIIHKVLANKGDLVVNGSAIASIISSERDVFAEVSEENFSKIVIGQEAKVRFLSHGGSLYDSKIVKIFPTADPKTQRYTLELDVDIPQDKLVPGLTGEVTILVGSRENAKIIPTRALMGYKVFVIRDGKLVLQDLELGYRSLTNVEVLSGVEDGELIVVEELERFKDDDSVVIVEQI